MSTRYILRASRAVCLLAATGCTVYAPMQPSMPLVQQRGQAEASASLQPSARLEATAAYSPLAHCVVTGAGTLAVRLGQVNYLITRQAEVGVGGYWHLGPSLLLSTLAGGGYAYTERQFTFLGTDRYAGTYAKAFGQAGIAYIGGINNLSLSYRLAHLRYGEVQTSIGPLPAFQTQRHEVLLAARRPMGLIGSWFWQCAIGISFSSLQPPQGSSSRADRDRWFAAGPPVPLYSLGIVWQPGY